MIIGHNIESMIACNRANMAAKTKASAIEKLSSGLRINSASDDAAGSVISEKMKGQIRGLEQADRNIQDGISLVQTAEAGLGVIQDPNLLRMRKLVVQALDGTLNESDRANIQKELDSVKAGIDDIANNTEFNTIKVLSKPVSEVNDNPPAQSQPNLDIVFMVDNSGSMTGNITTVKNGITDFVNNLSGVANTKVAIVNLCQGSPYDVKNFESDPVKIADNLNGLTATDGTRPYEIIQKSVPGGEIGNALSYRADSKKIFVVFTDTFNEEDTSGITEDTAKDAVEGPNAANGFDDDDIQTYVFGMGGSFPDTAFDDITNSTGGKIYHPLSSTDIKDKLENDLTQDIKNSVKPVGPTTSTNEAGILKLQVGANSGEEFNVELFDARTKNLGIDDISVDTIDGAEKALEKIDNAMDIVSKQRTKFGAYQDAIEHVQSNVGNYNYNITSAESKLSDVDMAQEVMEMNKSNIIEQAAQSILQQSEKMPQSILDLISKWQGNS